MPEILLKELQKNLKSEKSLFLKWCFLIDNIRILSIGLELASNGGLCGKSFSNANNF